METTPAFVTPRVRARHLGPPARGTAGHESPRPPRLERPGPRQGRGGEAPAPARRRAPGARHHPRTARRGAFLARRRRLPRGALRPARASRKVGRRLVDPQERAAHRAPARHRRRRLGRDPAFTATSARTDPPAHARRPRPRGDTHRTLPALSPCAHARPHGARPPARCTHRARAGAPAAALLGVCCPRRRASPRPCRQSRRSRSPHPPRCAGGGRRRARNARRQAGEGSQGEKDSVAAALGGAGIRAVESPHRRADPRVEESEDGPAEQQRAKHQRSGQHVGVSLWRRGVVHWARSTGSTRIRWVKRWDYPRSERLADARARRLVVQPAVSAAFDPTEFCTSHCHGFRAGGLGDLALYPLVRVQLSAAVGGLAFRSSIPATPGARFDGLRPGFA